MFSFVKHHSNFLMQGTKVMKVKSGDCICMAVQTGFNSFKGQIFRSMLFATKIQYSFYKSMIKFMCYLSTVSLVFAFISIYQMVNLEFSNKLIVLKILEVILAVIPPVLPVFFLIVLTITISKLDYFSKIQCTDSNKMQLASQINCICFDKTGTLTESDVNVAGYLTVSKEEEDEKSKLGAVLTHVEDSQIKNEMIFKIFATCHEIKNIGISVFGEDLDMKMFKFSKFNFLEVTDFQKKAIFSVDF